MSRNATASPLPTRRGPQWTSHARQISKTSFDRVSLDTARSPDTISSNSTIRDPRIKRRFPERTCTVTINESVIGDEILLNLDILGSGVQPGDLMSVTALKIDQDRERLSSSHYGSTRSMSYQRGFTAADEMLRHGADAGRRYIFVVRDMPKELKTRHPGVEVYVAKHIGDAFGMKRGTQVLLAPVDEHAPAIEASHVELLFKDMYLSRADMWRLAVADLANRTIYKGQVVYFLGTIKATVMTVFVDGRKTQSAFFGRNTRPIFRSESARYVLLIQMAREMWDFDSDGSGEIMFYKVVNGFLPALFKKWAMLQVKHLVSIVLFARIEYDAGLTAEFANSTPDNDYYTGFQTTGDKRPYKDFYRAVVNDISNGEWTTILHQLKREFNNFRKDISLYHLDAMSQTMDLPEDESIKPNAANKIRPESSLAMYGNVLEAINLTASQYVHDYIDRDLLRTGISIVVITPGSGVFEVEYESLRRTTEAMIGNGIGIDLICIPKVPLHSVPLFRYRNPHFLEANQRTHPTFAKSKDSTPKTPTPLVGSLSTLAESLSPSKVADSPRRFDPLARLYIDEWAFALPQWLHVSYWTGRSEDALSYQGITLAATDHFGRQSAEEFSIRCRLYDLQMRSVLETNEIETTPLHADPNYPFRSPNTRKTGSDTSRPSSSHQSRRPADILYEPVYGFQKFVPDRLTKAGQTSLWKQLQGFDESRARLPSAREGLTRSTRELDEVTRKQLTEDTGLFGSSVGDRKVHSPSVALSSSLTSMNHVDSHVSDVSAPSRRDSTVRPSRPTLATSKMPSFMRQISLGQRGFGIAAPKAAMAELKMENVNISFTESGQKIVAPSRLAPFTPARPSAISSSPRLESQSGNSQGIEQPKLDTSHQSHSHPQETPSRPIAIKPPMSDAALVDQLKSGSVLATRSRWAAPAVVGSRIEEDRDIQFSNALRAEDAQKLFTSKLLAGAMPELPSTLSPTTAMAPWLVLLNPSNPDVNKVDDAILFNRWQHVFPKPSQMQVMKWKALSCPAAVPLTTEYFPTKTQFENEYQRQPYTIAQNFDDEIAEEPKSREEFLRELISARFAHGFQVVIGPSVAKAFGQKLMKFADIFSRDSMVEDGTSLFMSHGNIIHQLSCVNGTEVEVNIFVRKPTESLLGQGDQPRRLYKPAIRAHLEPTYESRQIDMMTLRPEKKNWNYIDSFIAGHTDEMTEQLRFWRARFVLIPMTSHRSFIPKTANGQSEDNEEEIRLEGIKKLAQNWQRCRYLPPSERHFQSTGRRRSRDPNPLDIVYKTEDPSVVIAAELETLPLLENIEASQRKGQLVSNRERFSKDKFIVAALADAIQQPLENGGVPMRNRRWHLRLHYNCFIGSDMTTWLLDNFEDLESREEAVELGNALMVEGGNRPIEKVTAKDAKSTRERGIFVHVEHRHPFRDGQYFYQISSEFAKPHPPGWLGGLRGAKKDPTPSVPSTPLSENAPKDSPRPGLTPMPRPTSLHDSVSPASGATTPTLPVSVNRRPKVVLSKVMKYDVDHRKKSYRPERVNLHYDRLHNPDNCYHIRLEWMNVTSKLIEDAIKSWSAIAMQHGLRLVELPIAEACTITDVHPFRKPHHVKLALPPPTQRPVTYYDPNSFAPQTQPGRHYYQKALLRKFDFVLDFEAASSFPPDVDVDYSWGKPDFKYTQYVHRSGTLLVEITDDGDFIILGNLMYINRIAASQQNLPRAEPRNEPPLNERVSRLMSTGAYTSYGIAEPTPLSSPMFRPVSFNSTQSLPPREVLSVASPRISAVRGGARPNRTAFALDEPIAVKDQLEAFCADEEALESFYKETLDKGATAATPATSIMTDSETVVPNSEIPTLGLPPGLLDDRDAGATSRPGMLSMRRGSVQY